MPSWWSPQWAASQSTTQIDIWALFAVWLEERIGRAEESLARPSLPILPILPIPAVPTESLSDVPPLS